jgi:uncharacterized protein YlzI (FlbEa/FlbD family)
MTNRNKQRFIFLIKDSPDPRKVLVNLDHIKHIRENADSDVAVRFHDDKSILEFIDGTRLVVEESFNEVMDMIEESEQSCPTVPVLVENIHDAGIQ